MENNKTIKEKIQSSALAAQVISILTLVIMIITVGANIFMALCSEYTADFAGYVKTAADGVIMVLIAYSCAAVFSKIAETATPFDSSNVKSLRIIALCIMAKNIVSGIAYGLAVSIRSGEFDFEAFSFDTTSTFLIGGLVMMLAQIFNYGAMLQQESDETL